MNEVTMDATNPDNKPASLNTYGIARNGYWKFQLNIGRSISAMIISNLIFQCLAMLWSDEPMCHDP